ncbi:MAG: hypothetical protein ABI573_00870 [Chloroflexota bacterium]
MAGAPSYDPDLVLAKAQYFSDLYPYYGYEDEAVAPWITSWP